MARKQNIRFLMKQKLESYAAYGESKHADKVKTENERRQLKKAGATFRQTLDVNYSKDKIYSYGTMKTYQREIDKYANWLELHGMKKADFDTAKDFIQDYIDDIAKSKSSWTCNTALSALCKTFQVCAADYCRPIRHSYEIKRGSHIAVNDLRNEKKSAEILAANRVLGIRRNELKNIKVSDFTEYERNGRTVIELSYKGKGGKNCHCFYYSESSQNYIRGLLAGKPLEDKVFKDIMKQFSNDADLHSARREAAINMYNEIVSHPEDRDFYMAELKRVFEEKGKALPNNLDMPYKLRGKNKIEHERMGMETEVDRFGAFCVSAFLLNHYRVGVSVTSYLLHP